METHLRDNYWVTLLIHNYSHLASKTVYWDTSDSKELYLKNIKDLNTRQQLENLGYIDTVIEYKFNSDGFRTQEFDQTVDMACFGCSFTMGTGVHVGETWPAQLEALTGLKIANLGHSGSSNDAMFRFSACYLKKLKGIPSLVILAWVLFGQLWPSL